MIDNFSLLVAHGLMLLAAWRLMFRDDLDSEPSPHDRPARPGRRGGDESGGTPGA